MSRNVRLVSLLAIAFSVAILQGCCGHQTNIVTEGYCGVDCLLVVGKDFWPPHHANILAASFVDLDSFEQSSSFGRLLGQACSARLTQRGYNVTNLNLRRESIEITPTGEFFLSRDMSKLGQDYAAEAVLVGTYIRTRVMPAEERFADDGSRIPPKPIKNYVYVSLRLIRTSDSNIMAAYDYRIPIDDGIDSLLSGAGAP